MTIRKFKSFTPVIHEEAYVDESAIVIGDVSIGKESSVWPKSAIRGDVQKITIGERTNIQDGSILHVTSDNEFTPGGIPLIIGDDVTIGHGAILHACEIDSGCLIGTGSIVLDGAVVKNNVMIAAGSLVSPNKILESGVLYKGSPAKPIRDLTEKEQKYILFSSNHYVNVMREHKEK
tara:strand:+ start:125 stop:655 length:531 start_codon:yes stop_codon:yes gene_type:complete